jgi:hypothetical protein
MKIDSPFKNKNGGYYTRQLFYEENTQFKIENRVIKPMFTLHKDREGLINVGRVYVEECDPTGYKVAQRILDGDFTLWTVLMSCRWFVSAKEVWDRELDAQLVSEGLAEIRELAKNGMPAQKLAASKYLANKEYRKDHTANKGRPKREDIDRAAKDLAIREEDIAADLRRIQGAR